MPFLVRSAVALATSGRAEVLAGLGILWEVAGDGQAAATS
jgi:hypothetical protein